MNALPASFPAFQAFSRRVAALGESRPWLVLAAGFCVFEIAYYFAFRVGVQFNPNCASPFWIPDSILLVALLRTNPKHWWYFILGIVPIRLFPGAAQNLPIWFLAGALAVDLAKGIAAAYLLRRVLANRVHLESIRDFAWFGLIAVLVVPVVGAFGGAALHRIIGEDFWHFWEQWFLGDATAQLVATPAILYWAFLWPLRTAWPPRARIAEAIVLAGGLLLAASVAFAPGRSALDFSDSRLYLPIPFLFWAAVRFGMPGATAAVPVITFFAARSALAGQGPFSHHGPQEVAFALQNFLLLRSVPAYVVAAAVEQNRSTERMLRESEIRFRGIANTAPVFLWMSGTDALCEFCNEGWLQFTGRPLEQQLGTGWTEGIHPHDLERTLETYHQAFNGRRPLEMEYRLRRYDGEYRWVLVIGAPRYDPSGTFAGYMGSAVDITERKQAEENNRELTHIQRLAIMGELTTAIAHEVRQPLSAIMTNADAAAILLSKADPPLNAVREMLSDIQKDDQRANDVLSRIREFLRKREPMAEPLDIDLIAKEAFRLIAGEALRRRIDIRLELARDLPTIVGDRIQLQQLLLNLIVNAMDAMEDVPPADRRITLRTRGDDAGVEVMVIDAGRGIRSEEMPHLFDTFFTTRSDGTGLGLSIAWSIVVAHHGRIWAENNADKGATFHVAIPPAEAAA